jgi:hypothetical protein
VKVPVPSVGRIVLVGLQLDSQLGLKTSPAVVLEVHPNAPRLVTVGLLDFRLSNSFLPVLEGIAYGQNELGCWWWPPRVDETMEVGP